jgi:N utilization substance protein B
VVALQALFEIDCVHHDPEIVLTERLSEVSLPSEAAAFARQLVYGVLAHRAHIDALIHEAAPQWPLDQMSKIDVNILRLAVFEMEDGQVPFKVAINEAVELAKMFGSDSSPRFVNGVLGTVSQQVVR